MLKYIFATIIAVSSWAHADDNENDTIQVPKPKISYHEASDNDKINSYADKIDFAELDSLEEYKIPQDELNKLTPEILGGSDWNQEKLDQLYARLKAGPLPANGYYTGEVILKHEYGLMHILKIGEKISGIEGKSIFLDKVMEFLITKIAEGLWRGKNVETMTSGQKVLRNAVMKTKASELLLDALLTPERKAKLLSDKIQHIRVNRKGLEMVTGAFDDFLNLIGVKKDDTNAYLLFPAKIYCGQSLLDSRRESIIIDYSHYKDYPDHVEEIDNITGKDGLKFRDEVRQIKPGFYLGRAYVQKMFLLNFTLYRTDTEETGEECWPGTQGIVKN